MRIRSAEGPVSAQATDPFVLVVDDHEPSLHRLRTVVELVGHPCVSAGSAADALILCDSQRPRVVVTDLAMPELDGQGLARWLKARYPALPIILVTGQDLDDEAVRELKLTFEEVLSKPVDIGSLMLLLEQLMGGSANPRGGPGRP